MHPYTIIYLQGYLEKFEVYSQAESKVDQEAIPERGACINLMEYGGPVIKKIPSRTFLYSRDSRDSLATPLCHTFSKAFDISNAIIHVIYLTNASLILLVMTIRLSAVDSDNRNSYFYIHIRPRDILLR